MAKQTFDANDPHDVSYDAAYVRPDNLDPKHNGPFLDDIRREQENAQREARSLRLAMDDAAVDSIQEQFAPQDRRSERSATTKKTVAKATAKKAGNKKNSKVAKTAAKATSATPKTTRQTKKKSAPNPTHTSSGGKNT